MKIFECFAIATALLSTTAYANTEKVIFIAPPSTKLPDSKPGTDFLQLPTLTHADNSLRAALTVNFTSSDQPRGVDHWYLLKGLSSGQRYELRVCWSATQPTRFELDTYTVSNVFDAPHLIQNLAKVVLRPDPKASHSGKSDSDHTPVGTFDSVLFLHIQAAADYFSPNKTLMSYPPAVDVDIILDPYAANIFPRSLLPTALYLVVLAILGLLVSQLFWLFLKPANTEKAHND